MFYAILAVALVVIDQIVKYLVRSSIPLGQSIPFIPHVMDLTYVQNTGAAFSILREHTWLLTLASAIVVLVIAYLVVKGRLRGRLGRADPVRRRGQPHRPGRLWLCHRYVPDHLHKLRRVQRG